jgi:lipoate-protein ligase A
MPAYRSTAGAEAEVWGDLVIRERKLHGYGYKIEQQFGLHSRFVYIHTYNLPRNLHFKAHSCLF